MRKNKILVRGPALSQSGFGSHCRSILRMIDNEKNDLYLINIGWENSEWLSEDNEERERIDSLIMKTAKAVRQENFDFDLSLQIQNPTDWQSLCKVNVGVITDIVSDRVPEGWTAMANNIDKVIVPNERARNSFLSENVEVVPIAINNIDTREIDLGVTTDFNFLNISRITPRKNVESIVTSFIKEFKDEEVGLILKIDMTGGSRIDREHTLSNVARLCSEVNPSGDRKCKIYVLHGTLSEAEVAGLYTNNSVSCYVNSSFNENLGYCLINAASSGLPIVSPYYSSIKEYAEEKDITHLSYDMVNVKEDKDSGLHCLVKIDSLRAAMRDVYSDYENALEKAAVLKHKVLENNSEQNVKMMYNNIIDKLVEQENNNEIK